MFQYRIFTPIDNHFLFDKPSLCRNQKKNMGVECCAADAEVHVGAPEPAQQTLKDLPAIDWRSKKDAFERMEASLPFYRITIQDMKMMLIPQKSPLLN